MALTAAQIEQAGQQLIGLAAIFAPADAAILGGVLGVVTSLNNALHAIASEDPAAWAAIVADGNAAVAEWKASLAPG